MRYNRIIFYLLIFIIASDGLLNIANSGHSADYFTFLSLVVRYLALVILLRISYKSIWQNNIPKSIYYLFVAFLSWNIVTIVRGALSAHGYWDWKFLLLSSLLFFLIPLAFFVGKHLPFAKMMFKYVLKYLFVLGFLAIPLAFATNRELYARLMIPISVFILIIPYLRSNWSKLILLVAATSILSVIDFRTNIIKIVLSLLIVLLYYLRRYMTFWIKLAHTLIFLLPIVLLYLGVTREFNVFAATEKNNNYTIKAQKGDIGDVNLAGDTRTFLYREVLATLLQNGSIVTGEGGAGKYKSEYFETPDKTGRYGSEVGVLNLSLYSGLIGVILYLSILFASSYHAIYYSNNFLCKMFGLLLATRWLLFFVEEFTNFDLNTFFTWLIIGLISNKEFRLLTNEQMKEYFKFQ